MSEGIHLNAEMADNQLKVLKDCREILDTCRDALTGLREGQTSLIWTADGKSVELVQALQQKYDAGLSWLEKLERDVTEAAENLRKAIDDTVLLDENQKAAFQTLLYRVGPPGPHKMYAI